MFFSRTKQKMLLEYEEKTGKQGEFAAALERIWLPVFFPGNENKLQINMKFLYEFKVLLIYFQKNFHWDLLATVPEKTYLVLIHEIFIKGTLLQIWKSTNFLSSHKNNMWKISHYNTVYFLRYKKTQRKTQFYGITTQ